MEDATDEPGSAAAAAAAAGDGEAGEKLTPYQKQLFAWLALATFFEGFDTKLASLVLSPMGQEFGVDQQAVFSAFSVATIGAVAAFLTVRMADRYGRRPVLLVATALYALFSLGTAFTQDLVQFQVLQFLARMAMVTELAVAFMLLSEALPPGLRGRANGLLGAIATVGAALPAFFLPALGWRGLFVLGAMPLLFVPLLARRVRESALFESRASDQRNRPLGEELSAMFALFGGRHRKRLAGMVTLFFAANFWAACAAISFAYYVFEERGWEHVDLQWLVPAAVPFSFAGYALSGVLMDRIGRKATAVIYLVFGALASLVCYQSTNDFVIGASYIAIQMLNGIWPIARTFVAELFPTELRGDAAGLSDNLLGRWGLTIGAAGVGALAGTLGATADAVSVLVVANLVCVPLVWWFLPETLGTDLATVGEPDVT